jgi:3-oxoacyl-[acyl-carrier protein] reductase
MSEYKVGGSGASGRLAGKVAVVTGAASGIGLASAQLFAAEGARVLAVDLPGERLEAAIGAGRVDLVSLGLSITDADAPDRIAAEVRARFGQLDILFNNAGVASSILAANLDDAEWDRVVDVNLRAAFRITRGLIPLLVKSPAGRIINTASVMAQGTDWGLAAYCASKAGLEGLTRTLALELGKQGVTANCILPGAIRTGMTGGLWDARPDVAELWAKKSVLRRLGEPADIARAALFLASDDSAFITGQSLAVDGGLRLRI